MGLKEIVTLTVYQDTFDWHQQMTQDWKINAQGGGQGNGGGSGGEGGEGTIGETGPAATKNKTNKNNGGGAVTN